MRREYSRMVTIPTYSNRLGLPPGLDPVAAEPNVLRDAVVGALFSLSVVERSDVRERLLVALEKAGLNVSQCLLMLGAAAGTAADLTVPEIAALIRYVRLTEPKAMLALATPLRELLTAPDLDVNISGSAAQFAGCEVWYGT